jgi:hypothetical protein
VESNERRRGGRRETVALILRAFFLKGVGQLWEAPLTHYTFTKILFSVLLVYQWCVLGCYV